MLYRNEGIDGLLKIPSIGKAIASKIEEYLKNGEILYYNQLKSSFPLNLDEFLGLEGIGPKTLKLIYDKLKIKNLDDLQKACRRGQNKDYWRVFTKKKKRQS